MNNQSTRAKVKKLYELFQRGEIPTLKEHEVHPDLSENSRERYLYFTLPVCINFQRSSPAMWQSALKTYNDQKTRYLFDPLKVIETPFEGVKEDLATYNLSLQRNKHTEIWTKISNTFALYYQGDPRILFKEGDHDVLSILKIITKDNKECFPYLRGPKLSNYWLMILSKYTDLKLKNMHEISIIPDTHVIQSSGMLGLVEKGSTPEKVSTAWKEILKDTNIYPVQMHSVLWNWSRNNFKPIV